jgi:hypothetical protein
MYSIRVCTTDDRLLPAPELGPDLTWDRLTEALRREVGSEAAALLAEPVPDPGRGLTHWHVTADQDPIALSALPMSERTSLLAALNLIREKILARAQQLDAAGGEANMRLAAAMRTAVRVPDDDAHVWVIGRSPVLTAWGRHVGTVVRQAAAIIARADVPPPPLPPVATPRAGAGAAGLPPSMPGVSSTSRAGTVTGTSGKALTWHAGRWYAAGLWLLFLLLLGGIYYALLAACAIDVPGFRSLFDRCGSAFALERLRERHDMLRDTVREWERRLAQLCTDPEARRQPSGPEQPHELNQAPDERQAEQRVIENSGDRGKLDIILAWNGHADLDLHVDCPGGRISFNTRNSCGGKLDIDRNASQPFADTPVEHVTWVDEPPPGQYRVVVTYYDRRDAPQLQVPFTVVVRSGDTQQAFHKTMEQPRQVMEVTVFQR